MQFAPSFWMDKLDVCLFGITQNVQLIKLDSLFWFSELPWFSLDIFPKSDQIHSFFVLFFLLNWLDNLIHWMIQGIFSIKFYSSFFKKNFFVFLFVWKVLRVQLIEWQFQKTFNFSLYLDFNLQNYICPRRNISDDNDNVQKCLLCLISHQNINTQTLDYLWMNDIYDKRQSMD